MNLGRILVRTLGAGNFATQSPATDCNELQIDPKELFDFLVIATPI